MSATKIGENVTNVIKLKIYMKKTNFTSHKQYLLGLLFSRNAKESHTDQSILQCFYSPLKERTHKPAKETAAKNVFSSVYVIGTTYFVECFCSM